MVISCACVVDRNSKQPVDSSSHCKTKRIDFPFVISLATRKYRITQWLNAHAPWSNGPWNMNVLD